MTYVALALASFVGAAAGATIGGVYGPLILGRLAMARLARGARVGLPYEAPAIEQTWFAVGDGWRCRRCNVGETGPGDLPVVDKCPGCGFAGGELPAESPAL